MRQTPSHGLDAQTTRLQPENSRAVDLCNLKNYSRQQHAITHGTPY